MIIIEISFNRVRRINSFNDSWALIIIIFLMIQVTSIYFSEKILISQSIIIKHLLDNTNFLPKMLKIATIWYNMNKWREVNLTYIDRLAKNLKIRKVCKFRKDSIENRMFFSKLQNKMKKKVGLKHLNIIMLTRWRRWMAIFKPLPMIINKAIIRSFRQQTTDTGPKENF